MRKSYLIVLFLILVFAHLCALSQQQFLGGSHAQTSSAYSENSFIKIHFIFNQPKYAPGDTAFVKGYLLSSQGLISTQGKKIVNLKLYRDSGDTPVIYNRLLFVDGNCVSQIILPDNAAPGIYCLVAYLDGITPNKTNASLFYKSDFIIAGEKEFIRSNSTPIFRAADNLIGESKPLNVSITFDKPLYQTRDVVKATVSLNDFIGKSIKSNLTIAVIQSAFFKNDSNLTFNQSVIVDKRKIYPYYFRGSVIQPNGKPVQDSTLVTFYLNKEDFIYGVYTRNNGEFEFPLFKNFQDDEVFYSIQYREGDLKEAKIILDEVLYEADKIPTETLASDDAYGNFSKIRSAILKSYAYYADKSKDKISIAVNDEVEADYVVDMGKFEPFTSMIDVLGNIVQAVKYKKTKEGEAVRVFLKSNGYYASESPNYIIDGIMTDNTEYFLSLDPSSISKIKILRSEAKLTRYGNLGKNGIIAIYTKIVNHNSTMPRTERSLFITGINGTVEFNNQPAWTHSIPDIRAALYWNPEIKTDENNKIQFSFNTSDATGSFEVRVHGFAEDGSLVYFKTPIAVMYK